MSKRIDIADLSLRDRVIMATTMGRDETSRADKIICCECGRRLHALPVHLGKAHPEMLKPGLDRVEAYRLKYPGAPTQSAYNAARIRAGAKGAARPPAPEPAPTPAPAPASEEGVSLSSSLAAAPAPLGHIGPRVTKWMELPCGSAKARLGIWDGWGAADASMVAPYDDRYEISGSVEAALAQIALGIAMVENVLIIGPTGSGKTSLVNIISALSNQPVTRVNFYGDMRPSDLVGDVVMVETDEGSVVTAWEDGPVVTAMRRGHLLLIDEIDAAPPQVHTVLQRLTERHHDPLKAIADGKPHCQLLLASGEVVDAHPAFRIMASANTSGQGDMTGDYAGTFVLNAAALDRWGIKMRHAYPADKVWVKMLVGKTSIALSDAKMIVQTAIKVNEAKAKARCRASISPRKSLVWARLAHATKNIHLAARLSVTNGIDPADPDHKTVGDIIRQVVGR